MNENIELLNFIYRNSEMGIRTIYQLRNMVEDELFKTQLEKQLNEYFNINQKVEYLFYYLEEQEERVCLFETFVAYSMINIRTLTDKSVVHIAELLIQGSMMGIIDATKNLNKYSNAKQDIKDIMEELKKIEKNNIESLFKFIV